MTCRHYSGIMGTRDRKGIYITAFVIYMAIVAALCFLRPESLPEVEIDTFWGIPIDKVMHFFLFLPYPVLSARIFITKETSPAVCIAILTVLAVSGAGIAYGTEILQAHIGYRTYEADDLYADFCGIAIGAAACAAYITFKRLES